MNESFSIKCDNCGKTFLYFPNKDEVEEMLPCPHCDLIWEVYARVKCMDPFDVENVLVKPWSMR